MAAVRAGFAVVCVGILVYGILDIMTNFEENNCDMTYMFEMPEYVNISLGEEVKKTYPRYGLYVYGEGDYAKYVSDMNLQGVPVLFIPGNAGSHKQARSLASVALRRVEEKKPNFHFNYFTVDLNEEMMGLYGGTLQDQTEFVHLCMTKILTLYGEAPNPPSSVILVGHSMGGIIARALFTLPDFDPSLVSTIITQATPHQGPVLPLDKKLSTFMTAVNSYWVEHGNSSLSHVTVVSTGGGHRDVLVRNSLTSLKGIVDESRGVYTSTMSVPNAWVSTDHLCAVWCRQMVLATTRALFDIIDPNTSQVSTDKTLRMNVFRHHFLSHTGTLQYPKTSEKEITIDPSITWVEKTDKLWEYARPKVPKTRYIAVPIRREGVDSLVAISDVLTKDWICACKLKEGEKQCKKCTNLSDRGRLVPPRNSGRKVVHLELSEMTDMTHIILIVPQSFDKVEVMADLYNQGERHLAYRMPGFIDIMMTYPESVTKSASTLTLYNDTLFYSLRLQGIDTLLKAYRVYLRPKYCAEQNNPELHTGSMMMFHVPWSNEDTYSSNRNDQVGTLSLKLQSGVPIIEDDGDLELRVYTDPSCTYQLDFVAAPSDMLGQLMRFYGPLLPAYMVAVLLMGLIQQLFIITRDGSCPSMLDAIAANGQPFKLIPIVMLFLGLLQHPSVQPASKVASLPELDIQFLTNQGINLRFLPVMLFYLSQGVVNFQCYVLTKVFTVVSTVAALLSSRFLGNIETLWRKFEIFLVGFAVVSTVLICSSLGILIIYFVVLIKVITLKNLSRDSAGELSRFHFYFSVYLLWLWMLVISVPAFITWVNNVKYSIVLYGDPNLVPATVGVIAVGTMLLLDNPLPQRINYRAWYFGIYGGAVTMLLYGTLSLFRVPYIIVFTLSLIATCQAVCRVSPTKQTTPNNINQ
ncbi:GPI inositol-deacylase-like [Mizuhopecten yessoensis]|uniref:GPI inositol-deacylase n=1 Tax=Mizuhopecten yessoensis TaxID=6573 RepID=A0A210QVH4_MIZYE|nr:GPI inositol-deacylase-like [Mizuhopecten yessoensis]OWF52730.1 GPI inositol-deacylase [Mizuhopecten yessoensis]